MFGSTTKGLGWEEPPTLIEPKDVLWDDGQSSTSIKTEPMDFMGCNSDSAYERFDVSFEIIPKQESLKEINYVPEPSTSRQEHNVIRTGPSISGSLLDGASDSYPTGNNGNVNCQPEPEPEPAEQCKDELKCKFCQNIYKNRQNLAKHIVDMHLAEDETSWISQTRKPHKCLTCGKGFTEKYNLKTHELYHRNEKPHKCDFCPKSFVNRPKLMDHLARMHGEGEKLHKCPVCSKEFYYQMDVSRHLVIHSEERGFMKCENCPATFKTFISLRNHKRYKCNKTSPEEENNSEPSPASQKQSKDYLNCEFCEKDFENRKILAKHIIDSHLQLWDQDGRLKCEFCSKTFRARKTLNKHIIDVHVVDKEFQCSNCDRAFLTQGKLDSHQLESHGEHKCGTCGECFSNKGTLAGHVSKRHAKEGPYKCDKEFQHSKCDRSFITQEKLDSHQLKAHIELKCGTCGKLFSRKGNLDNHLWTHVKERPYKCDLCPKRFAQSNDRKTHIADYHPRQRLNKCPKCPKAFFSKYYLNHNHLPIHSEERKFKCDKCSASYKTTKLCNRHKKICRVIKGVKLN